MKSKFFLKTLTGLGVLSVIFLHSCNEDDVSSDVNNNITTYETELKQNLKNYEIVKLDYAAIEKIAKEKPNGFVTVNLNIPSKPQWEFQLTTDDLSENFAPDAKIYLVEDKNNLQEKELPESFGLQGKLKNADQNSYFILGSGELQGSIEDMDESYFIEPVSHFANGVADNLYVLYNVKDVIQKETEFDGLQETNTSSLQNSLKAAPSKPYNAEVTLTGDYQFYKKFNNWTKAANYLKDRLIFANKIHIGSKTSIRLKLKKVYVLSSKNYADDIPNSSVLLDDLNEIMKYKNYAWYDAGDINYFVTGDNTEGNYVGWARLSVLCNSPDKAFGIGKYLKTASSANNLLAHETGHIIGMDHDDASKNVMTSSLSNSAAKFTNVSKAQLNALLSNNHSCLTQ